MEQQRVAFEAWAKTYWFKADFSRFESGHPKVVGEYKEPGTQAAWDTWQAALAQPAGEPVDKFADNINACCRPAPAQDSNEAAIERLEREVVRLMQENQTLRVQACKVPEEWREAVQEFVDRCEWGSIRSRYTYRKFKALLAAAPEPKA